MKKILTTIAIAAGIILGTLLIFASINNLVGTIAFQPELHAGGVPQRDFTFAVSVGLVGIVLMTVVSRLGLRRCPLVANIIFVALGCLGLLFGLTRIPLLQAASMASPQVLKFIAQQRAFAIAVYPDVYPELVSEFKLYILGCALAIILLGLVLLATGILGITRRSLRTRTTTPQLQSE